MADPYFFFFNTQRSELDGELASLFEVVLYTCHIPKGDGFCGRIDMHGEPLYEEVNGSFVMTGIVCRQCWNRMLEEWLRKPEQKK